MTNTFNIFTRTEEVVIKSRFVMMVMMSHGLVMVMMMMISERYIEGVFMKSSSRQSQDKNQENEKLRSLLLVSAKAKYIIISIF